MKNYIIIFLLISIFYSCASKQDIINLENCKKIKIGMTENEIINIMGKPLSSKKYYDDSDKDTLKHLIFKYDLLAASTGIEVYINVKFDSVVTVYCDEETVKY